MSNAVQKAKPIDELKTQIDRMSGQIKGSLPSHISPDKFRNVILTVCTQEPDLLAADRRTLLASCLKCASDGLLPDKREAALVIFSTNVGTKDNPKWVKVVQYMPMIGGILKRMRNSKQIASFQAHVIHEHDHFVIRRGLNDTLEHEPKFPGDRGKVIGAYAVAKFKDGSEPQFEVMGLDEIEKVRNASKSKNSGPWTQWFNEMARKTVARRLAKWLPMDSEVEQVMQRDDEVEAGYAELPEGIVIDESPTSKLDALEHSESIDQSTGEIIEAEKVDVKKGLV